MPPRVGVLLRVALLGLVSACSASTENELPDQTGAVQGKATVTFIRPDGSPRPAIIVTHGPTGEPLSETTATNEVEVDVVSGGAVSIIDPIGQPRVTTFLGVQPGDKLRDGVERRPLGRTTVTTATAPTNTRSYTVRNGCGEASAGPPYLTVELATDTSCVVDGEVHYVAVARGLDFNVSAYAVGKAAAGSTAVTLGSWMAMTPFQFTVVNIPATATWAGAYVSVANGPIDLEGLSGGGRPLDGRVADTLHYVPFGQVGARRMVVSAPSREALTPEATSFSVVVDQTTVPPRAGAMDASRALGFLYAIDWDLRDPARVRVAWTVTGTLLGAQAGRLLMWGSAGHSWTVVFPYRADHIILPTLPAAHLAAYAFQPNEMPQARLEIYDTGASDGYHAFRHDPDGMMKKAVRTSQVYRFFD